MSAFATCSQLTSMELTQSVKSIDPSAFSSCPKLSITISDGNENYVSKNGMLLRKDEKQIIFISQDAVKNNKLTIPDTVIYLGNIAYQALQNIKVIEIPNSVSNIDIGFFKNRVPNIEITVKEGNEKYVTKNDGVYSKDGTILYTQFKNTSIVTVPEGVKALSNGSFYKLGNLTQVHLPQSLETIESAAFTSCFNLHRLELGINVKNIAPRMDEYSGMQEVIIDKDNPYYTVENNMIFNKNKTVLVRLIYGTYQSIEIPEGVKEILYQAFYADTIMNITLPSTLEKLSGFNNVLNLSKIDIPSSVTTIDSYCFSESSYLKEIVIHKPEGSIPGSPWGCIIGTRGIQWVP